MSEPVLDVQQLTKRFGTFTAVDAISFSIGRGEIFGFLGPNGAGKSTTIRMLCGVLPPTSGQARALGIDLFGPTAPVRRRMGYMSQKFSLMLDLTVEENLRFFGGLYGLAGNDLHQRVERRLRELHAWDLRAQLAGQLSTGERQRAALASATLHGPDILFLDEPTSGVDPLRRRQFWAAMDGLVREGMTILVTTHNLSEADQCDRLAFILGGRLMACGRPRDLKASTRRWVLTLRTERFRELRTLASGLPGVHDVLLQGRSVRISFPEGVDPNSLLGALESRGFTFTAQAPERPSLEDLFVDLVRQDRGAA
ncbi:MAG: putative ABC transporter ATP-binding protein YbhF [Acidobacteria bacterium ADurb.Bin340]|nr:MAG: putative ABC transporter ATP-binding protein YbhF [Acidobacteria bacterium ADurb.Bin340]